MHKVPIPIVDRAPRRAPIRRIGSADPCQEHGWHVSGWRFDLGEIPLVCKVDGTEDVLVAGYPIRELPVILDTFIIGASHISNN